MFLLIGQSNMAGRATIEDIDRQPIDGAFLWNEKESKWQSAVAPFNLFSTHRKAIGMQRLNCGPSFVREYRKMNPDCRVGIVCMARGGTSIEEWRKGRLKPWPLYDSAVAATKAALADGEGVLKGVLWHQGESNSRRVLEYPDRLQNLVENLRADLKSPRLPFVFSQLGPWRARYAAFNRMITAQPHVIARTACVSTTGLTAIDDAHFDSASQRTLGARYAKAMIRLLSADQPLVLDDPGTINQPVTLPRSVVSGPFRFEAEIMLQRVAGTAASVWFTDRLNFGFDGRAGRMFFETPRVGSVQLLQPVADHIVAGKAFQFAAKRIDDGATIFSIDGDEVFRTPDLKGKRVSIRFRPHRNVMVVKNVRLVADDLSPPPPTVSIEPRRIPMLLGSKNEVARIRLKLDRKLRLVGTDAKLAGSAAGDVASLSIAAANSGSNKLQELVLQRNGAAVADATGIVLGPGLHWLKLMAEVAPTANLRGTLTVACNTLVFETGDREVRLKAEVPNADVEQRLAVAIHRRGEHDCHTTRIPGIARANDGTLLAVYDLRYNSRRDLQEDIDIGLSRSTDNGQTWEEPRAIMDMGEFGGKPQRQNGCSDPNILVDRTTGEILVSAVWTHGKPNTHQWVGRGSEPGFGIHQSSQFMVVKSADDGLTWTAPRNLTRSLKNKKWWLFAPAPGNGITLKDGALVMPTQGRDESGHPFSNIMSSRDHGKTWKVSPPARRNTTECSVAELSDGSLMLNMRDNRNRVDKSKNNGRAVSVTADLGENWTTHKSDHKSLPEPVCMASLISHRRADGQHMLVFANPNSKYHRRNMTLQFSFDDGKTWPVENQVLLDESGGAYSSLVVIDDETVGILYESSQANLVYQLVPMPSPPAP